ncbi:hypothetical protein D9M72_484140 [compost metagenome]
MLDDAGMKSSYSLVRLDLQEIKLPAGTRVVVIARRGNAELRTDHGAVENWSKGFVDITELGSDGVWAFRLLFVVPGSPKLVAVIENVRPDGLGNSESLIGMEAADLGDVHWELQVLELDGRAVIQFNKKIYASVAQAAEDKHFWTLVFPEAIRRIAMVHAVAPEKLDESQWEPFRSWLSLHGITDDPSPEFTDEQCEEWCREVVRAFCSRHQVADILKSAVEPLGENE